MIRCNLLRIPRQLSSSTRDAVHKAMEQRKKQKKKYSIYIRLLIEYCHVNVNSRLLGEANDLCVLRLKVGQNMFTFELKARNRNFRRQLKPKLVAVNVLHGWVGGNDFEDVDRL